MVNVMIGRDYLRECFHYNPDTGIFTPIERPRSHFSSELSYQMSLRTRRKGVELSARDMYGYLTVWLDGSVYKAHRLAFLYMTGEMPKYVDHINQVKDDNRWCNLRPATKSQNCSNVGLRSHNTSGTLCVSWSKRSRKWLVSLTKDKKKIYIGMFDDFELAELVAGEAREHYHGEFARNV